MSNFFPQTPPGTPPQTPPRTPSPNNNDSQYSSDYNDEWDNYMNNPNVTRRRTRANSVSNDDDDDFIQGRELLLSDLNGDSDDSQEEEEEEDSQFSQFSQGNQQEQQQEEWAPGKMPPIPRYPKQIIDVNAEGFDPILMDNQKVEEYLKDDLNNIAILCNGKIYLTTRETIYTQEDEAIVYECLEGDKKRRSNVVADLPLYNIKKIGINLSSDDAAGIEPEYIYMSGIDVLLLDQSYWQYYSIIPLPDKMLVSVISTHEASKIGSAQGSGWGAVHCQAGQGGMAGIIVKAYPSNSRDTIGGKKKRKTFTNKKRKTVKKRKTLKKRKMVTLKKKNNKKRKSGTKKRN